MNRSVLKRSIYRWPTATSFNWLASFLERAEIDSNVVAVIVVGSAARPWVASDDLDLMVLCRDVKLLREKAPIEIDIRKANVDDVESNIRARQDLAIWCARSETKKRAPSWRSPTGRTSLVRRWRTPAYSRRRVRNYRRSFGISVKPLSPSIWNERFRTGRTTRRGTPSPRPPELRSTMFSRATGMPIQCFRERTWRADAICRRGERRVDVPSPTLISVRRLHDAAPGRCPLRGITESCGSRA